MHEATPLGSLALVPEMVYRDARAGIAFLERAFGFKPSLVVPAADGRGVVHAELWNGRGCVMVAGADDGGTWMYRTPAEIGGVNTAAPYLAVDDIESLHARAGRAPCLTLSELTQTPYGSRDFSARDPEGHLWFFGTYRPAAVGSAAANGAGREAELFAGARYADARAAISWLGRAFGATENLVVPGDGDDVAHAQLAIGEAIFMLGSTRDDEFNFKTPRQLGGAYTHSYNVTIADPDGHCAHALAAGAEIVVPLADTPYGARGYVARDCEGYIWGFSTYAPARPAAGAESLAR